MCHVPDVHDLAYVKVTSGNCAPGTEIKSVTECQAAAKYLQLPGAATQYYHPVFPLPQDPPFCHYSSPELWFNQVGQGDTQASCTTFDFCLCLSQPKYVKVTSGNCAPGTEIKSDTECEAAARYLQLDETTAYEHYRFEDPPYCHHSGPPFSSPSLQLNICNRYRYPHCEDSKWDPEGSCTTFDFCLCLSQPRGAS